jgi:hypothetical protein
LRAASMFFYPLSSPTKMKAGHPFSDSRPNAVMTVKVDGNTGP